MKKVKIERGRSDMRAEYDFSRGVRGKYARQYAAGTNIVVLDPDVAESYHDPQVINQVLRAVAEVAAQRPKNRARR